MLYINREYDDIKIVDKEKEETYFKEDKDIKEGDNINSKYTGVQDY